MNQQEIFDKVASHLITQGVQATSVKESGGIKAPEPTCAYRGDNGTMCAAGCLIPDDEYESWFEGATWDTIKDEIPSLASLPLKHHDLISTLQFVHDTDSCWRFIDGLKEKLRDVAFMYGLSSDILN